jgi:hypothetical protein
MPLGGAAGGALTSPELALDMTGAQLDRIGANYIRRIHAAAPAARRIVDKMTENFRFAGLIALALPHARMIHVRRDSLDTCLSCFCTLFAEALPYAYDLAELGRHHGAYEGLMDHWRMTLPPGMMLEVRYEEVIADLEDSRAGSSITAASNGTRAASNFIAASEASAPPASLRCAARYIRRRSDAGGITSPSSSRSSRRSVQGEGYRAAS